MIYLMKPLPDSTVNTAGWKPFIQNQWFRNHFMSFVYCLQVLLLICSLQLGAWQFSNVVGKACLFIATFFIHELLHFMVIYRVGDVSITHSGLFFWMTSGAVLTKARFLLFMSLPFVGLTVVPAGLCLFLSGDARAALLFVAWINAVIAGSDIINSVLIAIKPNRALFHRGYYHTKP